MLKQFLILLMIVFIYCLHPLQKTLALIGFVLILLIELGKSSTHWICYLFALIYFGGVLILFTYISSVVPNFSPNSITILVPVLLSICVSYLTPSNLNKIDESFFTSELPLSFMYSSSSVFILLFILSMVVMLLMLSVSILSDFKSPLRNV